MKSTVFRIFISLLVFYCFSPNTSTGQIIKDNLKVGDTTQIHRVVTERGDVFLGLVTHIQDNEVRFLLNKSIELTFQLQDLKEIRVMEKAGVEKAYTYDQSRKEYRKSEQRIFGHERGYYLPTGFLLKKGENEYRNSNLFYNSYEYGVSDHLNIGVGGIPLILANLLHARVRAGFSIEDFVHLSANVNGYAAAILQDGVYYAAAWTLAASVGNPERHLTVGTGYGFGFEGTIDEGILVAQVEGSYRLAPNWRIFGEGIIPTNEPQLFLFSGGTNWIFRNNRVEFGLSLIRTGSDVFPFPFVGYGGRF